MNIYLLVITCASINSIHSQTAIRQEDEEIEIEGVDELEDYDENEKRWIHDAVVNVAYYLRFHKFNNYDRRYFDKPPLENVSNIYGHFVEPPLRYFHWEVFQSCKDKFIDCLRYLYETVLDAYLQRAIDTIYIMRRYNLSFTEDAAEIENIENECNRLKELDWNRSDPFDEPVERFQWSITASYYMCWYTMLEMPELKHFGEPCDNYANCLQKDKATSNHDIRADDAIEFQCAMYSFCPDACCHNMKLIQDQNACAASFGNPCFRANNPTCSFNRTLNRSFISLVYNEWNVSCICQTDGYRWNSRYGLCIDYNECENKNPCDPVTEDCVNDVGTFICRCKFRYKWSEIEKKCVDEELMIRALKRFSGIDPDADGCACIRTTMYLYSLSVMLLAKYSIALIGY